MTADTNEIRKCRKALENHKKELEGTRDEYIKITRHFLRSLKEYDLDPDGELEERMIKETHDLQDEIDAMREMISALEEIAAIYEKTEKKNAQRSHLGRIRIKGLACVNELKKLVPFDLAGLIR